MADAGLQRRRNHPFSERENATLMKAALTLKEKLFRKGGNKHTMDILLEKMTRKINNAGGRERTVNAFQKRLNDMKRHAHKKANSLKEYLRSGQNPPVGVHLTEDEKRLISVWKVKPGGIIMADAGLQRRRNRPFSERENATLMKAALTFKEKLLRKGGNKHTMDILWEKVTRKVNNAGGRACTVNACQKRLNDMKRHAQKKADSLKEYLRSGQNPQAGVHLTEDEKRLISIWKVKPGESSSVKTGTANTMKKEQIASTSTNSGYVYLITEDMEDNLQQPPEYFKIGLTRFPHRRLTQLQKDNPRNLEYFKVFPVNKMSACESKVKQAFKERKARNGGGDEWFVKTKTFEDQLARFEETCKPFLIPEGSIYAHPRRPGYFHLLYEKTSHNAFVYFRIVFTLRSNVLYTNTGNPRKINTRLIRRLKNFPDPTKQFRIIRLIQRLRATLITNAYNKDCWFKIEVSRFNDICKRVTALVERKCGFIESRSTNDTS
ncbi:uncharacterized protein LOC122816821 isoform X1 [Protopterus annectens]|uniref:uncharacterized protein LOC122816821 isoform X1 n=1 Tax=Protopterus annectens TaxID=7888 RepID=UPI001CFC3413|nr:uncharacterized protein LOC122816821 isoform X1 [Protopterus annectens]